MTPTERLIFETDLLTASLRSRWITRGEPDLDADVRLALALLARPGLPRWNPELGIAVRSVPGVRPQESWLQLLRLVPNARPWEWDTIMTLAVTRDGRTRVRRAPTEREGLAALLAWAFSGGGETTVCELDLPDHERFPVREVTADLADGRILPAHRRAVLTRLASFLHADRSPAGAAWARRVMDRVAFDASLEAHRREGPYWTHPDFGTFSAAARCRIPMPTLDPAWRVQHLRGRWFAVDQIPLALLIRAAESASLEPVGN